MTLHLSAPRQRYIENSGHGGVPSVLYQFNNGQSGVQLCISYYYYLSHTTMLSITHHHVRRNSDEKPADSKNGGHSGVLFIKRNGSAI